MAAYLCSSSSIHGQNIEDGYEYKELVVPPGHRFIPTDSELVEHYLLNRILRRKLPCNIIAYIGSLLSYDPGQLPIGEFKFGIKDQAYFFTRTRCSYSPGEQPIKYTRTGYWKDCSGADEVIYCGKDILGFKRKFVFYQGEESMAEKTCWKLSEYRPCLDKSWPCGFSESIRADAYDYVLCKIQKRKSISVEDSDVDGKEDFIDVNEEDYIGVDDEEEDYTAINEGDNYIDMDEKDNHIEI